MVFFISVISLVALMGFATVVLKWGRKSRPDYHTLFLVGLLWIPLGMAASDLLLTLLGVVLIGIGASKRSQWIYIPKKGKRLTAEEKREIFYARLIVLAMAIIGIASFYLFEWGLI
ncbi:MAG: hypothetical protein JW727_03205 [Candidatus Aenigmarchaeota archaeon]|nr:hypothetical protein [Candidatus Aenigmarchaeota archaeon]